MPKDYSKFLEAPIYIETEQIVNQVRIAQIIKGADKYGVPLDPSNHTPEELVRHAMEENVDQSHYIVAMGLAFEALQKKHAADMKSMAGRVASGDKKITTLNEEIESLKVDLGNQIDAYHRLSEDYQ